MSKQNWKVGETYDTVGGSSVRVISLDGPEAYPIVGIGTDGMGNELVKTFTVEGRAFRGQTNDWDLVPPKRVLYVVYYADGLFSAMYHDEAKAKEGACSYSGTVRRFVEADDEIPDTAE